MSRRRPTPAPLDSGMGSICARFEARLRERVQQVVEAEIRALLADAQRLVPAPPPPVAPVAAPAAAPADGLLRVKDVAALVGAKPGTIWDWVGKQRFPAPTVRLGRYTAWALADVRAWQQSHRTCPTASPEHRP